VVAFYAMVWALIALTRALNETSSLYADRHRRWLLRASLSVVGILCAADVGFTLFVLWIAYGLAFRDPQDLFRFEF